MATAALAKVEFLGIQLSETRIEFSRDYASNKDLAESETRFAASLDGLRVELRGMNDRLDRIIDGMVARA